MKIAILGDALDRQYAGVHYYLRQLVEALGRLHSPHEIAIIRAASGELSRSLHEIVVPFPTFPGAAAWRFFVQLPAAARRWGADVVIEPGHFGPFNLPSAIKRVTVIHDLTPVFFPEMHVWHSQQLQKLLLPRILKKAAHIFTNSEYTQADLAAYFPSAAKKSTVLLPGRDTFFQPIRNTGILKKYNIRPPYLLYVGTLEPRKDIPTLLRAFHEFKKGGYPHQLVLAGKVGWRYRPILKMIDTAAYREDIRLTGYVERADLPVLYSMAEQFIYPSRYEGFGLPVLEAMCCGTPVVTTNVSSLPEVGGAASLYFPVGEWKMLFEKMVQLAGDEMLRKHHREKGLERVRQFEWESTAKKMLNTLEQL